MKEQMRKWKDKGNLFLFVLMDILLINIAMLLALQLRFDMEVPVYHIAHFWHTVPFLTVFTIGSFFWIKLYDNVWEYASIEALFQIAVGSLMGTGLVYVFSLIAYTISSEPNYFLMPRTVYFLSWIILMLLIGFSRLMIRVMQQGSFFGKRTSHKGSFLRVMVVGGGWAGANLIREIQAGRYGNTIPVIVVDDNPAKKGKRIHGVPVAFGTDNIGKYANQYNIDEIIIAIATPTGQLKPLIESCLATGCKLKMVTALQEVGSNQVTIQGIRDVNIEDLLGRHQQELNMEEAYQYFHQKVILITGGGGSIGSELCKQVLAFLPKKIILFDMSENYIYDVFFELQEMYGPMVQNTVELCVGSVQDEQRLNQIFETHQPQVVIHAAAHKHVPLMESAPEQAVKNNVFGTYITAKVAKAYQAERFILISTDKAVNPTNIMGATKRCAEMIVQAMQESGKTDFVAVRFGNVLASHGSVVPLFERQIKAGGPITITHPQIIRYFMSIPEAASLVLQAGAMAKGGEVFVLDMGEPIKIKELAQRMIQLYTPSNGVPVEIKYVGLRPGEKLYEELLCDNELVSKTQREKIFVAKPEHFTMEEVEKKISILEEALTNQGDIKKALRRCVPTFVEPSFANAKVPCDEDVTGKENES
ncbi:MAG: polysaccharide biosynthesis protein [Clostridiales bacterium]|nr:polysaccharide biosynthesis protein [Clostridiales bacterium]